MELLASKLRGLGGRQIHPPLKTSGDGEFVGRPTDNRTGGAAQKTL